MGGEDERYQALGGGSGYAYCSFRIYDYFTEGHDGKEAADFLKHEYGTGGRSHALAEKFQLPCKQGGEGIRILAPALYKIKEERDMLDPVTGEIMLDQDGMPQTEEVEIKIPAFRAVSCDFRMDTLSCLILKRQAEHCKIECCGKDMVTVIMKNRAEKYSMIVIEWYNGQSIMEE